MRSARRFKPRKIGADSSSEGETSSPVVVKKKPASSSSASSSTTQDAQSTVVRPKPRRPTTGSGIGNSSTTTTASISDAASRLSFTDEPSADKPFQIKKSALSRKAIERSAAARAGGRALPLPVAENDSSGGGGGGVTYSKEYLEQLRSLTPSSILEAAVVSGVPVEDEDVVMGGGEDGADGDPLGTKAKFGTTAADGATAALESSKPSTSIPDPAIVKVLKARRAAAAAAGGSGSGTSAKDFISLSRSNSPSDNDSDYTGKKKKKHSRLVRTEILDEDDDPELASFVNDPTTTKAGGSSRLVLTSALSSRKNAENAERHRRRDQIQEALELGSSSSSSTSSTPESSDGEKSNHHHPNWHHSQLRAATSHAHHLLDPQGKKSDPTSSLEARLRYQPPFIPPLPNLDDVVKRLEELLGEMTRIRDGTVKKVKEVRREKGQLERREGEVQEELKRVGEAYAKLGIGSADEAAEKRMVDEGGVEGMGRGLESLGGVGTPVGTPIR